MHGKSAIQFLLAGLCLAAWEPGIALAVTIETHTPVRFCLPENPLSPSAPYVSCTEIAFSTYLADREAFTDSCLETIDVGGEEVECDSSQEAYRKCAEAASTYPPESRPRLCKPGPPDGSMGGYAGAGDPSCGDGGLSLSVSGEYPVTHRLSFELELGHDDLDLHRAPEGVDVNHVLVGLRGYLRPWRRMQPFGTLGAGIYDLEPGPTEEGYSVGLGLQYELSRRMAFEVLSRYHRVGVEGPDVDFTTLQIGLRARLLPARRALRHAWPVESEYRER